MTTSPLSTGQVAIYARVSTEDQAAAETIQPQVELLRRYCELHGLDTVGEYLDHGVSGTVALTQRPECARLVAGAAAGRFRSVISHRVSRLSRRLAVVLDAYDALDAENVVIKSATEHIDTSQPIGRFIFQMLGAFAELDRETILDNTTRGRARGARQGRWYGVARSELDRLSGQQGVMEAASQQIEATRCFSPNYAAHWTPASTT